MHFIAKYPSDLRLKRKETTAQLEKMIAEALNLSGIMAAGMLHGLTGVRGWPAQNVFELRFRREWLKRSHVRSDVVELVIQRLAPTAAKHCFDSGKLHRDFIRIRRRWLSKRHEVKNLEWFFINRLEIANPELRFDQLKIVHSSKWGIDSVSMVAYWREFPIDVSFDIPVRIPTA